MTGNVVEMYVLLLLLTKALSDISSGTTQVGDCAEMVSKNVDCKSACDFAREPDASLSEQLQRQLEDGVFIIVHHPTHRSLADVST